MLLTLLLVSLIGLSMGLAKQADPKVRVDINSSVSLYGATYHPHSEGVEMPQSHAKALGFTKDDYLDEPEEQETEDDYDLPKDLFKRDALIEDERFDSKENLLENAELLTEVDGIGKARAESIIEDVQNA